MTTQWVALQDFCEIRGGGKLGLTSADFVEAGVPAFGAGGINGYVGRIEFREPGVVLSSIGARCGKCFLADGNWTSLANTQVILPDPEVGDARFLWFQLNDEKSWHRSGTAQPFIKPSDVKVRKIYLPPIEEQRRIADILDRADALRTKRREALAHLDTLTQSIFLDMFGDARRVSRWPTAKLGDLIGETRLGLVRNSEAVGDHFPVPYVRMNAITATGELSQAGLKRTTASPVEMLEYRLQGGDILFNTRNSRELVGKSALVTDDRPWIFNNNILRIRLLPETDPHYVAQLLLSPYGAEQLERRKSGTTSVFAIYYKDLATMIVPLPPMQLQRAFSDRYVAIARSRTALRAQQRVAEQLFDSLQQRAFAGELA